jgi:hypothetical protein
MSNIIDLTFADGDGDMKLAAKSDIIDLTDSDDEGIQATTLPHLSIPEDFSAAKLLPTKKLLPSSKPLPAKKRSIRKKPTEPPPLLQGQTKLAFSFSFQGKENLSEPRKSRPSDELSDNNDELSDSDFESDDIISQPVAAAKSSSKLVPAKAPAKTKATQPIPTEAAAGRSLESSSKRKREAASSAAIAIPAEAVVPPAAIGESSLVFSLSSFFLLLT